MALRADLAAYLGHGLTVGAACGRPTAPTRSSSSCCRPSAGRAARRSASRPSYSMHPLLAPAPAPAGSTAPRGADFALTAGDAVAQVARAPARRGVPLLAEQPDRHRAGPWTWSRRCSTRRRGMVVVDEAYAEFARPGTPSALDAAAGAPAAGRHPHDEQGVRASPAAGWATWPPTRRWSTRCSWSGCPTTSRR